MHTSATLQAVLTEFAPLFGLSFSIFALKGFRFSHTVRWRGGFWTNLLDIVLSSAIGAFLITGFCILIAALRPDVGDMLIIGLAIFLSVGGVTVVDGLVFKYFGVHILTRRDATEKEKREDDHE